MLAEDLGGADRERRIEEYRGGRYLTTLHQVDQVDADALGAVIDDVAEVAEQAQRRLRRS